MTPPTTDASIPPAKAAESALPLSPRAGRWVLLAALLLAAALMGKQWLSVDNVTKDAAGYYLPLAAAVHDGQSGLHPIIPPLYPTLTGWLSRLCAGAEDPLVFAGQLVSGLSTLGVIGLIYALGATLYGPRVGAAAAVLTAANPYLSQLGASVGPEMLYAALLTAMALTLVRFLQRPTITKTAAAAVLSALAALTRSEGIVMPAVALATVTVGLWRPKDKRAGRIAGHLLPAVLVIAAIWAPRLVRMHQHTGLAVLDVRIHRYLPGVDVEDVRSLHRPPAQIDEIRLDRSRRVPTTGERVSDAAETLTMVIGPVTWVLAAVWVLRRGALRTIVPGRPAAHGLLALVFAVQILAVAPVTLSTRYAGAVAPLAQVWGALGLVTAAEVMRRNKGVLRRVGDSMRWQWVLMALLAAGLSTWSLLKSNSTARRSAIAVVGRKAFGRTGAGSTVLACDARASYYAQARWVRMWEAGQGGPELTAATLLETCRTHCLDWIVIQDDEQWSPWLMTAIRSGTLPEDILTAEAEHAFVSKGRRRVRRAYLIDAQRLAGWLQSCPDVVESPSGCTGR